MSLFIYVLRTFPELSETFISREMQALTAAGHRVCVLAAGPGRRPELSGINETEGMPPVAYLSRSSRQNGQGGRSMWPWSGRRRRLPTLARALLADLVTLAGHPRRSARALRLALYAWRGAALLPADDCRLHAHFANDAAALARYLAAVGGCRYTVTAHAYDIYSDPFLLRANLAGARRVFTVSQANMNHMRHAFFATDGDDQRLRLLHCGLDLPQLPYVDPGEPADPAHLVCIARLVPKKGHQVLLEAVARLRDAGRPLRLTLVGEGPEQGAIQKQVKRLNLDEQVTLRGAMDNAGTLEELRGADLCVLAARVAEDGDRDGLPVVLMEAAAMGVPLVATRVGGIPELVDDETGWLAPPDQPEALAQTLASALDTDSASRLSRSRLARARIEAEFNVLGQVRDLTAEDL